MLRRRGDSRMPAGTWREGRNGLSKLRPCTEEQEDEWIESEEEEQADRADRTASDNLPKPGKLFTDGYSFPPAEQRRNIVAGGCQNEARKYSPAAVGSQSRKKTNGYLLFVYHRKGQLERETGKKLTQGLPQMMKMFDSDWKALPEGEKTKWKNKAKDRNEQQQQQPQPRQQQQQYKPPYVNTDEKQIWAEEHSSYNYTVTPICNTGGSDDSRRLEVKQFLDHSMIKDVTQRSFAILNFNNFLRENEFEFTPAELGIVIFSISQGIWHEMHTLIDYQFTDSNYTSEAKQLVEKYGLPSPSQYEQIAKDPELSGPSDYKKIVSDLRKAFVKAYDYKDDVSYNVCFAPKGHINFVDGCLNWLMRKSGHFYDVKVLPLESLMCELSQPKKGLVGSQSMLSEYGATLRLENSAHIGREDLACVWHQQKKYTDFIHKCAFHKSRKQAYVVLDMMARAHGITSVDGKHAPPVQIPKEPYKFYADHEDERVGPTSLEIQDQRRAVKAKAEAEAAARKKALGVKDKAEETDKETAEEIVEDSVKSTDKDAKKITEETEEELAAENLNVLIDENVKTVEDIAAENVNDLNEDTVKELTDQTSQDFTKETIEVMPMNANAKNTEETKMTEKETSTRVKSKQISARLLKSMSNLFLE